MEEQVKESIQDAELVLVGLGEELDLIRQIKKESEYLELQERTEQKWLMPFIMKVLLKKYQEAGMPFYRDLERCLKGKNYFIVSLCEDGLLTCSDLCRERMAEPCGGYAKLQCSEKCHTAFYEVKEELLLQVEAYVAGECREEEMERPVCPVCKKPLVFNRVEEEQYAEEGYLEQWTLYKKWLQGTVNRKLCVLELGVGMKYPTVIRWAFEKVVFFNQKAEFYRVHSKLYQMTKELCGRGNGICQSPEKFVKELSNGF